MQAPGLDHLLGSFKGNLKGITEMTRMGSYWNGIAIEQHSIFDTEEEANVALALLGEDEYDYSVVEKHKNGSGYVIATYEKEDNHFVGFL
jgi:hypothetical protein